MLRAPYSSTRRPALSAIRRALPADRRHLFLRLMPFSFSAPQEYGDLQTLVHECLTAEDPLRRAVALTDLLGLFDGGLEDVPRRPDLIAEIASHVQSRRFSCVAAEAEFVARLDMVDVTLDEYQSQRGTAGGCVHRAVPTLPRREQPPRESWAQK